MQEIKLTEQEIIECKEEAIRINQAIENTTLKSYFNTEPLKNRWIGQIGQLTFKKYLQQQNISFEEDHAQGQSDKYDFKINNTLIDIKTNIRKKSMTNIQDNFKLLLLQKQLGRHADIYVWILVNHEEPHRIRKAYIIGFLNTNQIKKYEVVEKLETIKAHWIPIQDTIPINELKNVI
jgi:hypothetical protein